MNSKHDINLCNFWRISILSPSPEKRNIQSLKHSQGGQGGGSANGGGRKKRELYYEDETLDDSAPEILEPVYQSAPLDYEELMEAMNEAYTPYYNSPVGNHVEEKRYLGKWGEAGTGVKDGWRTTRVDVDSLVQLSVVWYRVGVYSEYLTFDEHRQKRWR